MSATTKTLARKVNTADKRDAAPVEKRMIDIGTMMERILAAISGWRKVVQSEFDCYTLLDEKSQKSEVSRL